ncbi:HNH endonuclease signature motif containing protein [Krasilnikovia sp. MM14-A1259]|uniref:HNH endonuclease signature motif containing protein n=1 Tax=Krasilnikovia sp. MM14-A1259 TaxID=3373539 RepID=UPI0038129D9E
MILADEYDLRALIRIKQHMVVAPETGCWVWQGACIPKGYGKFYYRRRLRNVHRVAYELLVGPIPEGMQIDHFVCENPPCCNPDHLRPVTVRENLLRSGGVAAQNAAKTHCSRGHEFTSENTYWRPTGGRRCRACWRVRRQSGGCSR